MRSTRAKERKKVENLDKVGIRCVGSHQSLLIVQLQKPDGQASKKNCRNVIHWIDLNDLGHRSNLNGPPGAFLWGLKKIVLTINFVAKSKPITYERLINDFLTALVVLKSTNLFDAAYKVDIYSKV